MPLDLTSAATFADGHPWAEYARLRATEPIARHAEVEGPGFWAISKHADVRTISRQSQRFSSEIGGVFIDTPDEITLAMQAQMMLNMDPPRHDRFKLLVSRGFTPKSAAALADRVTRLAAEIVDDVAGRDEIEFVSEVAGRLPSGLIAELMGIPRADGERLYELTEIMHTTDLELAPLEKKMAAIGEMLGYAANVAQTKRANPADDIATTLVQAEVDGERLTDEELQWFFLLLVNAGGDTTRNLVAAGLQLLFDHPAERARLLGDLDGLMPTAIDEMLRFTTPVIYFRRTLTEDVVMRRGRNGRGRQGRAALRLGQPRRGGVRRPRPLRCRSIPEPAHGLRRRWAAPVPRHARRPTRDRCHVPRPCSAAIPISPRPATAS